MHIDRLKGLLEEGAAWEVEKSAAAGEGGGGATATAIRLLIEERAKVTELELGSRALAAELLRAQHARWVS